MQDIPSFLDVVPHRCPTSWGEPDAPLGRDLGKLSVICFGVKGVIVAEDTYGDLT